MPAQLSVRQLGALLTVAAVWGAAFIFIRVASPVLGPVAVVAARMGLAGMLLLAFVAATKRLPAVRPSWAFVVLGALWASPFLLIAVAQLTLTASMAAVLNATTPLFSALLAMVLLGERLTRHRAAGLVIGVLGVAVVVGWTPPTLTSAFVLSALASLSAAALYAAASIYTSRRFKGVPGVGVAAGQQLAGAGLVLLLLPVFPPGGPVTTEVGLSVAGLAVVSTAIGFVLFFRLLEDVGPTSALTTTYLVPVFGIVWGATFLGEPIGWSLLVGLAVILGSVALVAGLPTPRLARKRRARSAPDALNER